MKSHMKSRKHRDTGGANDAEMDLKEKNMEYTKDSNVNREAVEKKAGGRAKRAHGGKSDGGMPEKKMVGNVSGPYPKPNAGRKPRKQGGGTYSDSNPFTSARKGTPAPGRKLEMEME